MSAALSLPHVPSGSEPSYGGNVGLDAHARITVAAVANVSTTMQFDALGWTGVRVFRMLLKTVFEEDCRMRLTALLSVFILAVAPSTLRRARP
jgi:hypothetical protein